jgi:hypothetical protein
VPSYVSVGKAPPTSQAQVEQRFFSHYEITTKLKIFFKFETTKRTSHPSLKNVQHTKSHILTFSALFQ